MQPGAALLADIVASDSGSAPGAESVRQIEATLTELRARQKLAVDERDRLTLLVERNVTSVTALERARAEMLDYQGRGLSVMEMSHRSSTSTTIGPV